MKIFKFDPETGGERGWIDLPDAEAAEMLGRAGYTQAAPPGCPPGMAHVMQGGAWVCAIDSRGQVWHDPVARQQRVLREVGEAPPLGWEIGSLPPIVPTAAAVLARARLRKWHQVKAAQSAADAAGFAVAGRTFQSDDKSAGRLQVECIEAMQAGAGWSTTWVLADNTEVTLTRAQMLAVGRALREHYRANHALARTLRAAIDAATSTAELEAITWPG